MPTTGTRQLTANLQIGQFTTREWDVEREFTALSSTWSGFSDDLATPPNSKPPPSTRQDAVKSERFTFDAQQLSQWATVDAHAPRNLQESFYSCRLKAAPRPQSSCEWATRRR